MIVDDRQALRAELSALLSQPVTAAALGEGISRHVPELSAYRENDDLILIERAALDEGTRRLLVRRVGGNAFRVAETAAASGSTNLLDSGGAPERDLDSLVDEILAFAAA
jgi:hypothetical protein